MPFLHLDSRNEYQEEWNELVKDHPAKFQVLIWNTEQERDHLYRANPKLDSQLFPRVVISVASAFQKLHDYGGIVIRGEKTRPTRNLRIILEDWKTAGPPKRFTVRGYGFPSSVDKTTIMISSGQPEDDPVLRKYHSALITEMLAGRWTHPEFKQEDVATL